eukprot:TRINITY_DN25945_c0_g1_i1.p1 TRINITY_DN25945_c0_g1~~TRINITY_DN25945_c0_g1_i1.p1  ORF type:complete len:224 (-),score=59.66 TRINITY_DN25945_c0_g1_i1:45-716(-)
MTLYYNPLSHNARVVHWFTTAAEIPVKIEVVNFASGDHKKPEFLKINPVGQVPAYKDGDVSAYESSAIIRYLAARNPTPLYPIDNYVKLGPIDSAYEHIRQKLWDTTSSLFYQTVLGPQFFNTPVDQTKLKSIVEKADAQFKFVNDNYFKDNSSYVVGEQLSIADIALGTVCFHASLAQPQYNITSDKFPKIAKWWEGLKETQHFKEAHKPVFEFLEQMQKGK